MSSKKSRAAALIFNGSSKLERSSSVDSYIMTSTEERMIGKVSGDPILSDGESENTSSQESHFSNDAVRVDIEDFAELTGSQNVHVTTHHSLRKCKTYILVPYSRLLKLIGWRPFGAESRRNKWGWRILNSSYMAFVFLLVIYSYIYDIMACQWKLDLKNDIKDRTTTTTTQQPMMSTLIPANHSGHIWFYLINGTAVRVYPHGSTPPDSTDANTTRSCGHIVTTYIIPDLLHVLAYVLGLWHFRIRENEHLYALMEKVFLQTVNMQSKFISQTNLIKKLRIFFLMGTSWVILTLGLQGLFVYSFGMERDNMLSAITSANDTPIDVIWLWILFAVDLLGVAVSNCINLAVVLNYAIQCEMLRYYINTIGTKLKERSTSLKSAMRDVLNIRESISLLNSSIARMTSLAVIRCAEMFIIGLCILILNQDDEWKIWLYRSVFPVVWALILVFPLIQAASMNAACSKFKTVSLNIRVYGYQNSLEHELDSFLLFIANTTLRSKLFHIPVKPSYLLGVTIVTCFTLLLLFQTSYVGPAGQLF